MVEVYIANISELPDPLVFPEIMNDVSEDRCKKILSFRHVSDRKLSLGAGLMIKYVLSIYGVSDDSVVYSATGKPTVEGVFFNVSHCGEYVICAHSKTAVGCDIEQIRIVKDSLINKVLKPDELLYVSDCSDNEKFINFMRLWTIKESYLKMTGEGISAGIEGVSVQLGNEVVLLKEKLIIPCFVKEYCMHDYRIAVCAEENKFSENLTEINLSEI